MKKDNLNIEFLFKSLTEEFCNEISTVRLHVSDSIIKKIKAVKKQRIGPKPAGLWYSCGDEWLRWIRAEMPYLEGEYYYKIDIDEDKILKISSYEGLLEFTKTYGVPNKILDMDDYEIGKKLGKDIKLEEKVENYDIDWPTVCNEYFGIEICPRINIARRSLTWYAGWDVASGCIWNKNAIKNFGLINKPPHGSRAIHEEVIGTSGGVRYYQLGGSLPDHLYNRTNDGKPTRDPGVPGIKKTSRKRGKIEKSSEDAPGKKQKRWYEKESLEYTSLKSLFEETEKENLVEYYPHDPAPEQSPMGTGIEGDFPFMNQVFYHGTNKEFAVGDYIEPPSVTGNVSEKGRKKNLDKIFFTLDKGSAGIYAGRAVQSFGTGSPHVYKVQPLGEVEWINKTPGTTVLMAPQAKVIDKVE